ncbi:interleukin-12 subunit beta-like [Anguilla rostrata]|uniref:interleukin-12 subunit beta-like n=1 Tax=Anguilla rostrata TaxID=7938 RepID=UPI0030D4224B
MKMNLCLFCLVFLLLVFLTLQSVTGAGSYNYMLKPNVLVVVPAMGSSTVQVTLQCGESYAHGDVVWRIKGREVARGNQVNIIVEEMLGGNYTCHARSGALLNHTLVLVQAVHRRILDRSPDSEYIHCLSKNYSGVFQCSWTWSRTRKGDLLLVTAARSTAEITCSLDPSGHSITCRDPAHCPYSEEIERIKLAVYVKNEFRMEKYTQAFYIAEIVKPDRITVTKVDRNNFEWGYPDTWSTPDSYFPLTFQVKVIPWKQRCDCECLARRSGKIELHTTQSRQWPVREGFLFCVRAQDALCNSSWSDWSLVGKNLPAHFNSTSDAGTSAAQNKRNKKKNRKQKGNHKKRRNRI